MRLLGLAVAPARPRRGARAVAGDDGRLRAAAADARAADELAALARAIGRPFAGRLVNGVQLPAEGPDYWTYDWGTRLSPNRPWRRWGTDRLVRMVLRMLHEYRLAHPRRRASASPTSRVRTAGRSARVYGGLGHASHQNGLDVDVLYPRLDKLELPAEAPALVDQALAQELVDRFVAAGAVYVFVGPELNLHGPAKIVTPLRHHDDHMHVRIR